MTLGKKLMLGFLIPVVMLLGAGFWSYHRFDSLRNHVDAMLAENDRSIQAAAMMTEELERMDSAALMMIAGDQANADLVRNQADSLFRHNFQLALGNITIAGETTLLDSLREAYDVFSFHLDSFETQPSIQQYNAVVGPAFETCKHYVRKLRILNADAMYDRAKYIGEQSYRATLPGMILMVGAVLFTLLFAWLIREHSVKPLRKLLKATEQWLTMDEYRNPEINTGDEIEELARTLENLESTLKGRYRK